MKELDLNHPKEHLHLYSQHNFYRFKKEEARTIIDIIMKW
jgi:hypothetical protein